MDLYRIGKIEAIALITIIMLNHVVLNVPKVFFTTAGSATLLNGLYVFALALIFLIIVLKLFKNFPGMDILDISHFLGGRKLQISIGILFLIYFISVPSFLLRNFCESLSIIYYINIPVAFILLVFIIANMLANRFGPQTIIKLNTIITLFMMINLIITFIGAAPNFDLTSIFPVFGTGLDKVFLTGASNVFAFSGLSVIYFIAPMLKSKKEFSKISIIGIVVSGIYLILCVSSLLLSFSCVIQQFELPSIYLIVRSLELGKFLQRPEAIFIVVWILAMMSYLSTCIMLSCLIFKKIGKTKTAKPMFYSFSTLLFVFTFLPHNIAQVRFLEDVVYKYFSIILLFAITFLILAFANLKYKKKNMKLEANKIE